MVIAKNIILKFNDGFIFIVSPNSIIFYFGEIHLESFTHFILQIQWNELVDVF